MRPTRPPSLTLRQLAVAALVVATGLASSPEASSGQARTVLNRGFEEPVLTIDWDYFPDSTVPGWFSPDGFIEIWRSGFNGVPAVAGNQFGEANAQSPSGFWQDVCLVAGESVPWRFYHRGRSGVDSMQVTLDGVELIRVGTGTSGWQLYQGTFVAPNSGPARVRFTPLNSGSLGNFVDELVFELVPHVEVGPDSTMTEDGANAATLYVSGTVASAQTVDLLVTGGSAAAGTDYNAVTTVTIPPGIYDGTRATAVEVPLGIVDDNQAEGDETVTYSIANPSGGIRLAVAEAAACGNPARSQATLTIADDDVADVRVTKTGPSSAQAGTQVEYLVTVTNTGPAPAGPVQVTDSLPAGATFVSASRGATAAGRLVTWPAISQLGSGGAVVDTVRFTFGGSGTQLQVARAAHPGTDPTPANNRATVSVDVCGAPVTTVSTLAGLRAAAADACVQTILLTPGRYDLSSDGQGALDPAQDKALANAGGGVVTLDADGASRVLEVGNGRTVTVDGLTLTGGRVFGGGDGGGVLVEGDLVIRNSLLVGNRAGDNGGGLYQEAGSTLLMENVTVTGNIADDRGGGLSLRSEATLRHVTVAGNSSDREGNGINREGGGSGPLLINTLVADNSGSGGEIRRTVRVQGVNLVEGGCSGCGGTTLTGDPDLLPLTLDGGVTSVLPLDPTSIAVDAAAPAQALATDQRGVARPQGAAPDIGAYELVTGPLEQVEVTPDGQGSPVQRATGTGYSQLFTVRNTGDEAEDIDVVVSVAPGSGSPFVAVDSVSAPATPTGSDSLRLAAVAPSASVQVTAWYSVAGGSVGDLDTLRAVGRLADNAAVADPGFWTVQRVCGPSTVTVSSLAELRAAMADACVNTIGLDPGTYDLSSDGQGPLAVTRDLAFFNTGGGAAVVDGGLQVRGFEIAPGVTASITGLTITGGYHPVDGGGIVNQGTLTLEGVLLTGNQVGDDGAGMQNNGGSVIVRNSTFSGNSSDDDGGGFENDGGSVTLIHVTIVGNRAGTAGDETGGAFKTWNGGSVSLINTIVSDNFQGGGTLIDSNGGTVSSNGGNLVEGGCTGCLPSDLTGDPGLLPLAFNGGDTRTHALASGSPAIDAGVPADGLATDQRGFARPEGAGFDIGAFERIAAFDVAVAPDGLGTPPVRAPGTGYTQTFTIANLSGGAQAVDLLGSVAGPALGGGSFLTIDSIVGPGFSGAPDSTRTGSLAGGGGSVSVQLHYSVGLGSPGQVDTLRLQGRLAAQPGVVDFGFAEVEFACGGGAVTVSTLAELRAAVASPCVNSIGLDPGTYDLSADGQGPLAIDRTLALFNTGGGTVTVDAGGASRVVEVGSSGDVTIDDLVLSGGFSNSSGGGILNAGDLVIRGSTIRDNATGNDGGGLASLGGSSLRLENVTVTGNTSADRGAGLDLQGTNQLVHVTVAENQANGPAGGINVRSGTTALDNSIVADNTQNSGPQIVTPGTLVSNGSNVVEGGCGACASGDLTGDPGLLPLALNGGTTPSYALDPASIALDAADPGDTLSDDQRGVLRPQGAGPDIGAYEAQGARAVDVTPDPATVSRLPSNGTSYVDTLTVANTGSGPAQYVLQATAGGTAAVVDSLRGPGLSFAATPDSALTSTLAPGGSVEVLLWYRITDVAEGTVDGLVLRAVDTAAPAVADTGAVSVTVVRPSLSLTKAASVTGEPLPGAAVTYQMTLTNQGSGGADSVVVRDSVPPEVDFQVGSVSQTLPGGLTATVEYADGGGGFGYAPVDGGCGAPTGRDGCVRYIRWIIAGTLPHTPGTNEATFSFTAFIR